MVTSASFYTDSRWGFIIVGQLSSEEGLVLSWLRDWFISEKMSWQLFCHLSLYLIIPQGWMEHGPEKEMIWCRSRTKGQNQDLFLYHKHFYRFLQGIIHESWRSNSGTFRCLISMILHFGCGQTSVVKTPYWQGLFICYNQQMNQCWRALVATVTI